MQLAHIEKVVGSNPTTATIRGVRFGLRDEFRCVCCAHVQNKAWDDLEDWLLYGIKKGFISQPYCATHDGIFLNEEETVQFDEGLEPCAQTVRVWPSQT